MGGNFRHDTKIKPEPDTNFCGYGYDLGGFHAQIEQDLKDTHQWWVVSGIPGGTRLYTKFKNYILNKIYN